MISFLGLGGMGLPMAKRLINSGHELTVWNRSPQAAEALRGRGAVVADSPRTAVTGTSVVITMLADATALSSVLTGLEDAVDPDAVVVDMSTVGPAATLEMAQRFPAYVDAPVLGSVDRAESGELVVFAGGSTGSVERVEPVLKVLGHVVPCGPVGRASALKIAMMGGVVAGVALLSETYTLARAMDLPDELVEGALSASPLGALLGRARSTTAHFPLRLAAKDLALALDQTPDSESLPLIRAAKLRVDAANNPEADLGSIVPVVEQRTR